MRAQDTLGSPATLQHPAVWSRRSTKEGIERQYGIHWYQRNIPLPWPKIREWGPGALIATLPSVIQTGAGVSGPTRGMLPQRSRYASGSSGDGFLALDSEYGGQAQPPLAEQPQRTKEEPYFSQRPILSVIRRRLGSRS